MIAAALSTLLLAGQPATAAAAAPDLSWLAGDWVACSASGEYIEERWLEATPAGLVGAGVTRRAGRANFEFLRIAPHEGGWAYLASPNGRHPATAFRWVPDSVDTLTFENAAHDFPQRIRYRRNGGTVEVFVGRLNDQGFRLTYRRPAAAGDCRP